MAVYRICKGKKEGNDSCDGCPHAIVHKKEFNCTSRCLVSKSDCGYPRTEQIILARLKGEV